MANVVCLASCAEQTPVAEPGERSAVTITSMALTLMGVDSGGCLNG